MKVLELSGLVKSLNASIYPKRNPRFAIISSIENRVKSKMKLMTSNKIDLSNYNSLNIQPTDKGNAKIILDKNQKSKIL